MDKTNVKYILSQRIKEERLKIDLTQGELAKKLNKSVANISGYETGDRLPPVDILCNMADIFSCTTDYLLGRTDNRDMHVITGEVNNSSIEIETRNNEISNLREMLKNIEKSLNEYDKNHGAE